MSTNEHTVNSYFLQCTILISNTINVAIDHQNPYHEGMFLTAAQVLQRLDW
jgi:hypothetical protein